ncbi:MAG: hypothetical protein IJX62_07655 [Clostridia bacterium]|nr:hypothetical protein [Clostridia bacterium]
MAKITVDFNNVCGKIKPMHAVNNMPTCPINSQNDWDGKMKAAHIPYGRLHDTGGAYGGARYVDVPNVFPDFDADENDPASYDFSFTDVLLARMVESGVMPYYRLGVTIENFHYIKAYRIFPPKDFAKWARICEHIILHYNEGWANGYHYNIEYWEIWNEPDNQPDSKDNPMWKGTMEEYFRLYEVTASHLKARFPHLKIGGYASCGFYALRKVDVSATANSTPRTEYFIEFFIKFLEYIRERNLPLDFFGWHSYAKVEDNLFFATYPRQMLDEYGYSNCEIHLNEWNPGIKLRGTLKDASNILSMMIALHGTPTDMCMYYDMRYWSGYCGAVDPVSLEPFPAYYAFYGFGALYALGKQVECCVDGEGIYALAATDGKKKRLLLVNANDRAVSVNISGISQGAKIYTLDSTHHFEEVSADPNAMTVEANAIVMLEQ